MAKFYFKQQRRLRGQEKYEEAVINGHLTDSASSQRLLEQAQQENGNCMIGGFNFFLH